MTICAVSADLSRHYQQQEAAQAKADEHDSYIKYCASQMAAAMPYEILMECEGVDVVEAIGRIVKAKTGLDLFEAQQMLIECINDQALLIVKRSEP